MQDAEEKNSQTEIKTDVSYKRDFYVWWSQGFSLNFYLASSKTRSIQQTLRDSTGKLNPKQLPRLEEKRILNSLLCLSLDKTLTALNTVGHLCSTIQNVSSALISTPLTATRQVTVLQPHQHVLAHPVVWTRLRTPSPSVLSAAATTLSAHTSRGYITKHTTPPQRYGN